MNPVDKRLAVQVEDHNLAYVNFEGIIPAGQYGAGAVLVWDSGTYDNEEWKEDKVSFTLHGRKLVGAFTLTRMKGKPMEWLLIKKRDEYARPDWKMEPELTAEKESELRQRMPPCAGP
jgi:bifunctional non-homologous end joining protein LigD